MYLRVKIIDVPGYLKNAETVMHEVHAKLFEKQGKLEIIGDHVPEGAEAEGNKIAQTDAEKSDGEDNPRMGKKKAGALAR